MMRRNERRNVIKIPVVFIISQNKNRFLPNLRIFSQNLHHLRHIPSSIPRCSRVIRKILRSHQPRDSRQFIFADIFSELIQNIAFRYFQTPFCTIVVVLYRYKFSVICVCPVIGKSFFMKIFLKTTQFFKILRSIFHNIHFQNLQKGLKIHQFSFSFFKLLT